MRLEAEAAALRNRLNSSLVKVSLVRRATPNWGAASCARLGLSKAKVNESLVDIGYAKPGNREMLFGLSSRPANKIFLALKNPGKRYEARLI